MKSLGTRPCSQKPHETAARPFFSKTSSREAETSPFFAPTPSIVPPKLQAESEEGDLKEQQEPLQTKRIEGSTASDPIRRQQEPEEERKLLQAKGAGEREAPSSVRQGLGQTQGAGQAMAPSLRENMEEAFGRDFSEVRLHTGDSAQAMSRDLNAKAFTHGSDVYFNSGEFNAESRDGRHLLAHELTHVVQQGFGTGNLRRDALQLQEAKTAESSEESAGKSSEEAAISEASWLTADLKQKWIAVVLAEAAPDNQAQEEAFAWIYYNRMAEPLKGKGGKSGQPKAGFGLRGSTAHNKKDPRYAIWLYKQGDMSLGDKEIPKWYRDQNPGEFVGTKGALLTTVRSASSDKNGAYQRPENEARLARVQALAATIVKEPGKNPIAGFLRQGNLEDFNNADPRNVDPSWRAARHYFHLFLTEKGLEECVKFYPASPAKFSQFIFHEAKIEAFLKARGIKKITDEKVSYVDVVAGKPVFVDALEDITALPKKKKPFEEPAKPLQPPVQKQPVKTEEATGKLQRQTEEAAPAPTPAPPAAEALPVPAPVPLPSAAKSWEEVKKSKEPIVLGKNLAEVEAIIGGGKYEQNSQTVEKGVAAMLLPVFQELAKDDFAGFEYDPVVGEDKEHFQAIALKAKEHMIRRLGEATKIVILARAKVEVEAALAAEAGSKDKPESPQKAKKRQDELIAAAYQRIQEQISNDPALKENIAGEARNKTAEELAKLSAGPICFFIARYLYYRAINRIDTTLSFAEWYRAQLKHGHVGVTSKGGLAWGEAQGTPKEIQGLRDYKKLDEIPTGVRLVISKQKYGGGVHWFLVFRDSQGVWRNLDHVYPNSRASEWHGNPTNPELLLQLWCVPSMTTAAQAAPTNAPKPAPPTVLPSPPAEVTPEEQRLQQCFQQIAVSAAATPVENPNSPPSP